MRASHKIIQMSLRIMKCLVVLKVNMQIHFQEIYIQNNSNNHSYLKICLLPKNKKNEQTALLAP